ncbi:hypothetical protein HZA43_03130 [Candidatus Peregrinibacteria bacterium]|nr:hypothetical protein [Candidatus Peregrinibacteria bacterium]
MHLKKVRSSWGMSSLIAIMIITAATLLMVMTMALTSIQGNKTSVHEQAASRVFALAEGCLEHALFDLNQSHGYLGEILPLGDVTCTIAVTGSGNARTVRASTDQEGFYTRVLEAAVDFNSGFQVGQWREVNN